MTMKNLIASSIVVCDGTVTCFPQFGNKEEALHVSEITAEHNKCFAVNNSVIAFVRDHQMHVTPFTKEAVNTLKNAKYHQGDFHVPFSNWDHPRDNKEIWDDLCARAHEINAETA